jgi:hypothetical protein
MCLHIVLSLLTLQGLATHVAQQSKNTTTAAITAAAAPQVAEVADTEPAKVAVERTEQLATVGRPEYYGAVEPDTGEQLDDIAAGVASDVVSDVASYVSSDEQEYASRATITANKQHLRLHSFSKPSTTATATGTAAAPTDDAVPQSDLVELAATEPGLLAVGATDHLTTLEHAEHNVITKAGTDEQCDNITAAVDSDVVDDVSTGDSPLTVVTEPAVSVLVLEQQQQAIEKAEVGI